MSFLNEISLLPIALACFVLSLFLFLVALFRLFYLFDRLLRYQYENYRDEWINDGKADGFFWHAEGSTYAEGIEARGCFLKALCRETPSWVASDNDILLFLEKLRFWSVCCKIFVVSFIVFGLAALAVYLLPVTVRIGVVNLAELASYDSRHMVELAS